jgi:preprotein translocase subunit YajC
MNSENITLVNNDSLAEQEIKSPGAKDTIMSFAPLVLIFIVFYFFVIRPQVKKQKAQVELIKSIKKGDKVIIAGGLIGKVVKEKEDNIIVVEIAKDVVVDAVKSTVMSVVDKTPATTAKK